MNPLLLASALALPAAGAQFDHSLWDRVVKQFVNSVGEVDYAALKADRAGLDAYVKSLDGASPDTKRELFPTSADELAYWLNAYNALVMKGVVDAYPTRSVRDLGALYGFFRRKDYTLGGQKISLLALENDIIRKRYNEPRIHFAIVCASMSCPLLSRDAFTAANLEAQLDRLTRQSLAERRMLLIDEKTGQVTLSRLFDWYAKDYGNILAFVKKHATEADRKRLDAIKNPRIRHFDYDWSINDPGSRAKAKSPYEKELAR